MRLSIPNKCYGIPEFTAFRGTVCSIEFGDDSSNNVGGDIFFSLFSGNGN